MSQSVLSRPGRRQSDRDQESPLAARVRLAQRAIATLALLLALGAFVTMFLPFGVYNISCGSAIGGSKVVHDAPSASFLHGQEPQLCAAHGHSRLIYAAIVIVLAGTVGVAGWVLPPGGPWWAIEGDEPWTGAGSVGGGYGGVAGGPRDSSTWAAKTAGLSAGEDPGPAGPPPVPATWGPLPLAAAAEADQPDGGTRELEGAEGPDRGPDRRPGRPALGRGPAPRRGRAARGPGRGPAGARDGSPAGGGAGAPVGPEPAEAEAGAHAGGGDGVDQWMAALRRLRPDDRAGEAGTLAPASAEPGTPGPNSAEVGQPEVGQPEVVEPTATRRGRRPPAPTRSGPAPASTARMPRAAGRAGPKTAPKAASPSPRRSRPRPARQESSSDDHIDPDMV